MSAEQPARREFKVNDTQTEGPIGDSLMEILEQEHHHIDDVLRQHSDGSVIETDARAALRTAVVDLRRHIFAEEELLFPPLRDAGMFGPIMVMLREHGQMWPLLDAIEDILNGDGNDSELSEICSTLFELLQAHNAKEEQILYPQLDQVVDQRGASAAREFLETGHLPEGWVTQNIRA